MLGRAASAMLVRPRAWWYNKVPLSVLLILLLVDGQPFSLGVLAVMAAIILAVCAVGNYGYALNDLFDIDEDARLGRANAAATTGARAMWWIIIGSAICAVLLAFVGAGFPGALLALLTLCLPLAYSVPPIRIKERKWLGVCADGLAAHVFPAALALLAVAFWALRPVGLPLVVCVLLWAVAAGLRGILSHQLHTADQDRKAGLATVVHDYGHPAVEKAVLRIALPLEVAAFAGAVLFCNSGPIFWIAVVLYLAFETFKTFSGRFRVTAFRPQGQPYVPFVEEGFYKAWGPIVLALDAARIDLLYLLVIPAYVVMFRSHFLAEMYRLRAGFPAPAVTSTTAPSARSNEES